jgi:hypothetical protein
MRLIQSITRFQAAQPIPSRRQIWSALTSIFAIWGALLYVAWAHWGNITVDCGREVYVPWVLTHGRKLYQDVWFPYGPAAPYFNAWLFALFGAKLTVVYWAGALSALVSAVLLLALGIRLSAITAGWTAAVLLLAQAMAPGTIFGFPLPYSFSAVYACVDTCLFLLLAVEASRGDRWIWMFASGCAAALALALKLEIGLALYAALAVLIVLRALQSRSLRLLLRDLGACLPGVAVCGLLLAWIMPAGGMEFLIQQNWMSTPGTYFMKTYGPVWMGFTGGTLDAYQLTRAALLGVATTVSWLALWWILARASSWFSPVVVRRVLPVVVLAVMILPVILAPVFPRPCTAWLIQGAKLLFLPPVIFLIVLVAAVGLAWACARSGFDSRLMGYTVLFTASGLVGLRLLHYMTLGGYATYVNGPAFLCLFLLLRWLDAPFSHRDRRPILPGELVLSVGVLAASVLFLFPLFQDGLRDSTRYRSLRGDLYLPSSKASLYAAAVDFIKDKASIGESVLSIPEDAGLYFFAGVECPLRVYSFTPGLLTPGPITEQTIDEIERKRVQYLIWSNRRFTEYGAPEFGTDFDQALGSYLRSHYRPMGPLAPQTGPQWNAVIWQRIGSGS